MTSDTTADDPLAPDPSTPAAPNALRPRVLPWVVLACTLLSTFAVAYYVWSKDKLRTDSAAREAAQLARDRIQSRMDRYVALLRGAAGLVANRLKDGAAQMPDYRDEFAAYVERLELPAHYPGVRGLGFALRINPDERGGFENAMRRAGAAEFHVWPVDPKASELFPIIYLDPPDARNRAAVGFDMFSEPTRRAAMSRARDTAEPSATAPVTLKQEIDPQERQNGFLIYLPVYHSGAAPPDPGARRAELAGFVYAPFRAGDLLDGIFGQGSAAASATPIDFSVYDGDTLLDRTDDPGPAGAAPAAARGSPLSPSRATPVDARFDTAPADVVRTIDVAGRQWRLRFRPHAHPELSFRTAAVPAVIVGGSLLSLALFLLSHSEGRSRLRAEQTAAELRRSQAALERANASLRVSERRLRTFTDANIVGMLIGDVGGRIHEANDAFLRLLGYTREDVEAAVLDWRGITAPEHLPGVEAVMQQIQRTGRAAPYEKELLRKDGARVPVLVGKAFLGGPDGRFVAFVLDLTERKRAEESLRNSEDQLRLVTDSLPVLIAYIDAAERYRFANGHYVQWFGESGRSIVGKTVREVLGDEAYEQRRPFLAAAMRGDTVRFHGPTPHKDGVVRETEVTYVPDRAADGAVRGFVSLVSDVTAQRRTEQTLRRYADLFEHAELGLVVTGPDGVTLEMANPAFARMCGFDPALPVAGRSLLDAFAPEYRTEVPSHVRIAVERGHHTFESIYQRERDGYRFPVEVDITAVKSPAAAPGTGGGAVVYHILSVTDITERERTEAELRYQLHLRQAITANAADALFLLDAEGRVTFMNPAAAARFGASPETAIGLPLPEVVRPNSGEGHLVRAVGAGETLRDYEDVFVCRDDAPMNVLCTSAPILNGDLVTGAVLVVHDITERKRAEQERERLLAAERSARAEAESLAREAEDANRSKDEFLATLSHELRTPLNAMLGWAQLLRMGNLDDDEFVQGLETIERNARVQAQLVEDLLDLSRIISGKLRLDVGQVDLPAVIDAALDSVRPAADAKGIRLVPALDARAASIRGDASRLQQVVWNLLSNAIKFTPRGGEVRVALADADGHAEVSVSDTGEGISSEFLPHVFDRLRQADASITRKHGGLGLGLSIVRHLVELHGGTVSAQSAGEGRGATFTVRLPTSAAVGTATAAATATMAAEGANIEGPPASGADAKGGGRRADPPAAMPSLHGVRVLVVDDEADARDLIARILRQCGAEVDVAGSAQDAVDALPSQRPDVLLSDIGMPGEDGYSLIRRVRSLPADQGGHTPAVALTAFARNEDRDRALAEGFQVHVAKPVEPAALARAVAELLGARDGVRDEKNGDENNDGDANGSPADASGHEGP